MGIYGCNRNPCLTRNQNDYEKGVLRYYEKTGCKNIRGSFGDCCSYCGGFPDEYHRRGVHTSWQGGTCDSGHDRGRASGGFCGAACR